MKTLVDWLCAQRYRTVIFATALTPILPMLTISLMTLDTVRRGPRPALLGAIAGVGVIVLLASLTGGSVPVLVGVAATSMVVGIATGALLRVAGVLVLAFQGTVLACFLVALGVLLFGPSPEVLFAPLIEELVALVEAGGAPPEQLEMVRGWSSILFGIFAALVLAQLLASLVLSYWWLKLARDEPGFGAEFRSLKLGRVLGIPAMVLISLGLVWDAPLIQNLTPVALFGFLFQGLSVMHAWAHAKQWHPGLIVPVYVLLLTPLTGAAVLGLSAVGLLDNIFDLRAPLRAQS